MELLGGLLVLAAMAWVGLTICAGGLCADQDMTLPLPNEPSMSHSHRSLWRFVIVGASVWMLAGVLSAFAASRPIEQLPKDLARWSTLWAAIPKSMAKVGQDDGPLAALTWGPVKGTVVLVESTTKEVWNTVKPDQRPGHRLRSQHPKGLIFRYEF